jgi:hypothetical protein
MSETENFFSFLFKKWGAKKQKNRKEKFSVLRSPSGARRWCVALSRARSVKLG